MDAAVVAADSRLSRAERTRDPTHAAAATRSTNAITADRTIQRLRRVLAGDGVDTLLI
jgi:hypothetical protein